MANEIVENVVIPFDYSDPESCLESIKKLERELLKSRVGADVFVGFEISDDIVYLHVQRRDLYVHKFHLNDTPPWSLDGGGTLRNRHLGFGHTYDDLWGGIENITVGLPRFESALYDITSRFEARGARVTSQKQTNGDVWDMLLKHGVASLIVMVLEPCRSEWFFDELARLLREEEERIRNVTYAEGIGIHNWGHISDTSRLEMENWGWIERDSPVEAADVNNAIHDPIYARDVTKIRKLPPV